jgi:hypothetical protein
MFIRTKRAPKKALNKVLVRTEKTMPPHSFTLGCDTKSHIWLIGEEEYFFDQSQRSPAGTLGGMLAARCAVGMKPF